ncbi:hypothetical protein MTO96_005088 [Rhipicephalus appendiculatus]
MPLAVYYSDHEALMIKTPVKPTWNALPGPSYDNRDLYSAMSNCRLGYEAAEPMTDLLKLQSLGNATQAETSKEKQRQEVLVSEGETMVEVFHGRDEPEEFPRVEIGVHFSDNDND